MRNTASDQVSSDRVASERAQSDRVELQQVDVGQVEDVMRLIGSRWTPAIMYALIELGTQRFSELRRLIPEVSQRMLTKQLRTLEAAGLVTRTFHESVPPRVEYTATALGRSLRPIYVAVCEWATEHQADSTPRATTTRAEPTSPDEPLRGGRGQTGPLAAPRAVGGGIGADAPPVRQTRGAAPPRAVMRGVGPSSGGCRKDTR